MTAPRMPYHASRREMTALVLIPALVGLMYPFLRPTPLTIGAGLLLLWAIVSVLRRREPSVRAWVEDIELVVVGLVITAVGAGWRGATFASHAQEQSP